MPPGTTRAVLGISQNYSILPNVSITGPVPVSSPVSSPMLIVDEALAPFSPLVFRYSRATRFGNEAIKLLSISISESHQFNGFDVII